MGWKLDDEKKIIALHEPEVSPLMARKVRVIEYPKEQPRSAERNTIIGRGAGQCFLMKVLLHTRGATINSKAKIPYENGF